MSGNFALLVSKFRGSLVGALIGDCFGQQKFTPQQLLPSGSTIRPTERIQSLRAVGEGLLVEGKGIPNSVEIDALATTPVALFHYGDLNSVVRSATDISETTNPVQAPGPKIVSSTASRVLHAVALHQALKFDAIVPLDTHHFVDRLAEVINCGRLPKKEWYVGKLEILDKLLHAKCSPEEAIHIFAKEAPEENAVLSSIFTFLWVQRFCDFSSKKKADGPVENVIAALSENKNEAMIALACSLTGAHHGIEAVPQELRQRCQGLEKIEKLADRLAFLFESQPGLFTTRQITFNQRV